MDIENILKNLAFWKRNERHAKNKVDEHIQILKEWIEYEQDDWRNE